MSYYFSTTLDDAFEDKAGQVADKLRRAIEGLER